MGVWDQVARPETRLKREKLEREIGELPNETDRANLSHTLSKLFMFLEDDVRIAIIQSAAEANAETVRLGDDLGALLHTTEAKLRVAEKYIATLKRSRNAAEARAHD